MLRLSIACVLGALLAVPTSSMPAQTRPAADVALMGKAFGAWNMPTQLEVGRVRGLLVEVGGRQLALEAKLLPAPVRGDRRTGQLVGVLRTLDEEGHPGRTVADVLGSYVGGPDGLGRFEATILNPAPLTLRRGSIEGRYADPMIDGKDPIGRFAGRWVLR